MKKLRIVRLEQSDAGALGVLVIEGDIFVSHLSRMSMILIGFRFQKVPIRSSDFMAINGRIHLRLLCLDILLFFSMLGTPKPALSHA